MRDCDIRAALLYHLHEAHSADPRTRVFDELGICQGACRVDVAVVNGSLSGYEIKSERDTLQRLPVQVEAYNSTFDAVTLVSSRRHAKRTSEMVPPWWGLVEALPGPGEDDVMLTTLRPARANLGLDPHRLVQLLWRDEALEELRHRGLARGVATKPRDVIWARLVDAISLDELRRIVRHRLRHRPDWRSGH